MGRNQEATQLIRNTADLLAEHNKTLSPEEANRLISEQMLTLLQNADTELEAREELLKKETQLQREEKEKQLYRLGGLVLLLLLLMAILVAIYRLRMNKNELRLKDVQLAKSMVENDYLRSRMDPHFVSNCISSAIGLVKKGDTEPAIRYMQHFEDLMRMLVKDHSREFVSLKEELDVTKNYAELEMQRLPKGLDMEIRMDENLKPEEIEMPPLILQPIIENAIKHGISGLDQRGNIRISGSKNGPQLVLEIRDNGRGFDSNLQKPASRGLKIIEERLAIFNKVSKANSSLEIRPSEQGTTVVLKMNID
jgi:LytS/YehU family sensor histidine kinase